MEILAVAFGGAIGAVARYLTYLLIRSCAFLAFPLSALLGTLVVNVAGSFALGLLMVWVERHTPIDHYLILVGAIGILGSFTTFSAFGFETVKLLREGHIGWAFGNISANLMLGLLAIWAGQIFSTTLLK